MRKGVVRSGGANENRSLWGRGFVARLSGAAAEFLQMWHIMMFGKRRFSWQRENLPVSFAL